MMFLTVDGLNRTISGVSVLGGGNWAPGKTVQINITSPGLDVNNDHRCWIIVYNADSPGAKTDDTINFRTI